MSTSANSTPIDESLLRAQLGKTLDATDFPALGDKYEGKVRDCYIEGRPAHARRERSL